MMELSIILVVFYILVAPLLTLSHEIGHAVVPLLRGQKIKIEVGRFRVASFRIGRLEVEMGGLRPWVGLTESQENFDLMTLAGGPLVSVMLGVGLLFSGFRCETEYMPTLLFAGAGWCFIQFVFTAVPITYPSWMGYERGTTSDGFKILQMLRSS